MKMPIGNLPAVIAEFAQQVLIPAAGKQGGSLPFAVGIISGLVAQRAPAMIEGYLPLLKSLGAVDEQNRIDVDLLYAEARDGGGLSSEDVRTLEKAWCAVATIKAVCKE